MASAMIITLPGDPAKEKELDCGIFCHHIKRNPVRKAELQVLCSHCPVLLRALHHQLPPPGPQRVTRQEAAHGVSSSMRMCPSWCQGMRQDRYQAKRADDFSSHTTVFLSLVTFIPVSLLSPINDFLRHAGPSYLWDLELCGLTLLTSRSIKGN